MRLSISLFFILTLSTLSAQQVSISQIDSSTLLANQLIHVYLSITDRQGQPISGLSQEEFKLFESIPNGQFQERPIIDFKSGVNINDGINYLFLLDNSGSMYENMAGRKTDLIDRMRISYAKQAIADLISHIKNPADRLSLISFNIKTDTVIELTDDKATISKALIELKQPAPNEGYTELYEALYLAVEKMRHVRGRKVIILLSDGENFPYQGKDPPQFKERKGLAAALELAQREGISIYTIGLLEGAQNRDLVRIATETGGNCYRTQDANQLAELYNQIRDRVLAEYRITYLAGMEPAERKNITVEFRKDHLNLKATRSYFSATLFGLPHTPFNPLIFVSLLFGLILFWLLSKTDFQRKSTASSLEVLKVAGKKTTLPVVTLLEDKNAFTISSSPRADLTISGEPELLKNEITVKRVGDEYTIVSDGEELRVNNQPVKSKKLRSGDLISIGGTTIVFNGEFKGKSAKALPSFKGPKDKNLKHIPRQSGKKQR